MHKLDLAVHPYTLQDDNLQFESTVYDEVNLWVKKGIDGIFTEFPHSTNVLFTHLGNNSNFPSTTSELAPYNISDEAFLQG